MGTPTILKIDYNSLTIQPNQDGNLGGGFGQRVVTTHVPREDLGEPPNTDISLTDLEVDGSAVPILKIGASICGNFGCEHATGIFLTRVIGGAVRSVHVHDVLGDGIYLHGNSVNVSILDSRAYRTWRVGINFDGLSRSVIAGNQVWSTAFPALDTENVTGPVTHMVLAHNAILPGPVTGDDRLDPPPVAGDPPAPVTVAGIELVSGALGDTNWSKTIIAKNRIDVKPGEGARLVWYNDALFSTNLFDVGGRTIGDGGTGVQVTRPGSGLLFSNNVVQGIQETTTTPFCTATGPRSEATNAALDLTGGMVIATARANVIHDVVTGLRNLAPQTEQVVFTDNIATGRVPAANANPASTVIHWGIEMPMGSTETLSNNIITGYDRQLQFISNQTANVNIAGNVLGGGALGRPIPSQTTGNASESAGLTFDEATVNVPNFMKTLSVVGNIAAPMAGGSAFLPIRHQTQNINAGYQFGEGELELGRNLGLDAMTYVYWAGGLPECPAEAARAQTPLTTISPGATTVGKVTLVGTATQVSVTFGRPLPSATYRVVAQATAKTGSPAAGSTRVRSILNKTTTGFTLRAEAAPASSGTTTSTTFEWMVFP